MLRPVERAAEVASGPSDAQVVPDPAAASRSLLLYRILRKLRRFARQFLTVVCYR